MTKIPDSQAFDRDPETWDDEAKADFERRIKATLERLRGKKTDEIPRESE